MQNSPKLQYEYSRNYFLISWIKHDEMTKYFGYDFPSGRNEYKILLITEGLRVQGENA